MSKFESTFKSAIAENERRVLIDSLRSSPELSLGEIARLSKGDLGRLFNGITIADLMGGRSAGASGASATSATSAASGASSSGAVPARRGRPPRSESVASGDSSAGKASKIASDSAKQRRAGKAKVVHTRTAEGRAEYDENLFQAVQEHQGPIGAGAIIARAGGSSLQARAGLARLIEAGRITWSGKARGTKYNVA